MRFNYVFPDGTQKELTLRLTQEGQRIRVEIRESSSTLPTPPAIIDRLNSRYVTDMIHACFTRLSIAKPEEFEIGPIAITILLEDE
ncbi:hypothetical protein [Bacillus sp. 7894-2]|uniref:hypothetical protein n=1 Tax=Bacillus sp. 7894-2 TaxID=2021695 RepID=UPI000BA6A6FE|nr:hypothetical protein [Bacillus sp. 7894-2]PAE24041.1 hypothetical protein CHI10_14650 [Bacillus sp. 7894-2]